MYIIIIGYIIKITYIIIVICISMTIYKEIPCFMSTLHNTNYTQTQH